MFLTNILASRSVVNCIFNQSSRQVATYTRKLTRTPGNGFNTHRSNRAKEGLYHGKDIRFGNTISHSHAKTKRSWHPNVFRKRVWSFAFNDWVRFNMTATAMKMIDDFGGIDNYLLGLDENSIQDSRRTHSIRNRIAAICYHKGTLDPILIRRFGYHKNPPPAHAPRSATEASESNDVLGSKQASL